MEESKTPEVENLMYFDPNEKEKYAKYLEDENFIVIEDDEGGPTIVTRKFTDEDWEEAEDYFNKHPLFFNDLTEDDLETNEYLQGLQAIKYDQDAETILERRYVKIK